MAPRSGRNSQAQNLQNGHSINKDPPPSTLAAQIVDNLTSVKQRSSPAENHAHLRQLLRMVLDGDQDGGTVSGAVETSIDINYRLIYTIVRAGLDNLFSRSPFDDKREVHVQAVNTLAVVVLTIRRSPEVLCYVPDDHDISTRPGGPLFLWLVPYLTNLLNSNVDTELQAEAINVLATMLLLQKKSFATSVRLNPVLKYIQGCIRDLIVVLEACEMNLISIDSFRVPMEQTVAEVYLQESYHTYLQNTSAIRLEGTLQIATVTAKLIRVVFLPEVQIGAASVKARSIKPDLGWAVDCLSRIWRFIEPRRGRIDLNTTKGGSYAPFLHDLRKCLLQTTSQANCRGIDLTQAVVLLCQCLASFLEPSFENMNQDLENEISWSICNLLDIGDENHTVREVYYEHLVFLLEGEDGPRSILEEFGLDLQRALTIALDSYNGHKFQDPTTLIQQQLLNFDDVQLKEAFHRVLHISEAQTELLDTSRPRKRARLSDITNSRSPNGSDARSMSQIYQDLELPIDADLRALCQRIRISFSTLSEDEQCILFTFLGRGVCSDRKLSRSSLCRCCVCDAEQQKCRTESTTDQALCTDILSTVTVLLTMLQDLHDPKNARPRVAAMVGVRRLLSHSQDPAYLDLRISPLGQWCLQALRSSLRDLRVAAGRTLTVFLQDGLDDTYLRQNRILALDHLRTLSEKNSTTMQETCLLTWGQVASISGEDEINLVLLRLVEYLGHTNPLISGSAFDELLRLCGHSATAAMRLFEPYWRTVAVTVVKDLQSRPQIAQRLCDLLNIKVSQFLQLTQFYTVPYLVVTKRRDIIQRIADASDSEQSISSLCMGHSMLAAILAYLLLQPSTNQETTIMSLLSEASSSFKDHADFTELMKMEPMLTAYELLKVAGEEDEGKSARIHQAIRLLAGYNQRRSGSARSSSRKNDGIGPFFEQHGLAIITLLADNLVERGGLQSLSERKRCIGAIREMIRLAKSHVGNALPQICACLQSAVTDTDLCNEAFSVWIVLLTTLGEEDVESLVNPTFAIIAQHWDTFNAPVQERTYQMISLLLKTHPGMFREMVNTIPSVASIPLLSKFEAELGALKAQMDLKHQFQAFSIRCQHENSTVVLRALIELEVYLHDNQSYLHTSAASEQPDLVVSQLTRSLLDACVRFSEGSSTIAILCAKCLGSIGCLDPTKIEALRERQDILVLSNFDRADETMDFVIFFMQEILVKAFLSATNARSQSFLGFVIQELLKFCTFDTSVTFRDGGSQSSNTYHKWVAIPEPVRNTLTPFLTSQYVLAPAKLRDCVYPLFHSGIGHSQWLRDFVFDLLGNGCGDNPTQMFPLLRRAVRLQDISIPTFLLPFAALNIVVGGTEKQRKDIANELLIILSHAAIENNQSMRDIMILCSQNVFQTLDYFSRWVSEKKKELAQMIALAARQNRVLPASETEPYLSQIRSVESVLSAIPAEIMSRRAVECKSFSRALFYWEQYIRQEKHRGGSAQELEQLYERLQDIYTQIDEPDGIEGISSHLQVLNIDQQVLEHRKSGRWTAVQSWYELRLTESPDDTEVQYSLLTSLKESGQHDVLLNTIAGMRGTEASTFMARPFAVESSWVTGKWDKLQHYLPHLKSSPGGDFNIGIGSALLALHNKDYTLSGVILSTLRNSIAKSLTMTTTTSLQSCHEAMLHFHILTEVEAISGIEESSNIDIPSLMVSLDHRLDLLGAVPSDKQYILGLRRAAMQLSRRDFSTLDLSTAWLTSARLARKGNFTHQAFNAVLHATQLGDDSATIEHSRLLWKEGHHRKAIQSLEGAIAANAFRSHDYLGTADEGTARSQQNILTAKAHLLLAKWVDRAGQTQSDAIISRYKMALDFHNRWEKGHYHLGKHYNKLLESEKAKLPAKQAQTFISGETAKLVIENYLRSLAFGAKHIYSTLPRIITLWLALGNDVDKPLDPKYGNDESFRAHSVAQRKKLFGAVNAQMRKYVDRLPSFVFYTAFAQIVARITHANQTIYGMLVDIIAKVVTTHPQQALWTLLAMIKSSVKERSHRGVLCMTKILENSKKLKNEASGIEVRTLMQQGQRLSDQLLHVCEGDLPKGSNFSISRDLQFNLKTAPCRLVIPLESTLLTSLPVVTDNINMKLHKPFSKDTITISTFLDDVLVLNSLQRPRKINIRGSDGHVYGLLCKPKDDLRKDQRLMEFNAMINRSLKKDAESNKRRLYIKTYAVTPLNEECGLIEWVDNLKTLRDILMKLYKQKNIPVVYNDIRTLLDEACKDPKDISIFTDRILPNFPPVFHEWFVEMFPEPGAWFTARLKYTRSCAVMSIVGHVLGLGDRHGENILFEEGNGGTLHVDFNCLFDKGLTFEKPELVPFRLTHNMVDAFGAYGYDGPYRKSSELTLRILRSNEDTLMTILETFVYDPTTDFMGKKKRPLSAVADTPEGVLETVRNKVRGLLPMESVPLSVEGYVDELVHQATDPARLIGMYIGWCAFF